LQVDLQAGPDGWSLAQVAQTGKPRLVDDLECIGLLPGNDCSSAPGMALVLPVARSSQKQPYGMLVVGISLHHRLNEEYQDFCFLVAGQIAVAIATIENARLSQQSREAIQMRDELLATVSHDLKNPLGAIKGYTQLLHRLVNRSSIPEREQLVTSLARIDATTARMTSLLNELIDLARAHLEQSIELIYGSLDYVALLHMGITEQQQTTQRQAIRLETTLTILPGRGDVARLDRVFSNLLSNAIKYTPGTVPVVIRLDREELDGCPLAVIEVRDQGIGIPAADLPHIFEQFHRASNVGRIKGTGVGLSSAKQIIELHGGTIAVHSSEGQGSTFTVRLPLYPEEA
jgi:signal transduction histidine kinase